MNGVSNSESEPDCSDYVEVDPTGRYGRYNELLGKGASKTVYRAFDEYEGIEVAWNQVKLYEFLQSPEELERLYREIHLLKTLKHNSIMKFYTSWVDIENRNINFVTEMFTSGTLRQYRLKHKKVNIRALKHWCRQILSGLLYLHSHKPPVIHRDLKCDNIFVNGNQGEVKIGDLGLAAILRKSHAAHCVGTPEFMAPEVYEEEYNELADIYSLGMCILEMVTFEYPYSECNHPAQIYKRVISGKKPEALYKVKDPEVRQFVEKCLATVSNRLPARELLNDPFLQIDNYGSVRDYEADFDESSPFLRQPSCGIHQNHGCVMNGYGNCIPGYKSENDLNYLQSVETVTSEIDLFSCQDNEHFPDVGITIEGRRQEDDGIFLRLRIADKEGWMRNIYFPFDLETDTALIVATEMVAELDITDQDVTNIADMIDGEIASLVPEWKRGIGIEENTPDTNGETFCHNCASNNSILDHMSSNNPSAKNLHILHCSKHGSPAVHGRFEEITYQVEGLEQCLEQNNHKTSSQQCVIHHTDIWAQRDGPELSSPRSQEIDCNQSHEMLETLNFNKEEGMTIDIQRQQNDERKSLPSNHSAYLALTDDCESEIRQELRWLKAKYQMQLRELRDKQLGVKTKSLSLHPNPEHMDDGNGDTDFQPIKKESDMPALKSFSSGKNISSYAPSKVDEKDVNFPNSIIYSCEETNGSCSPEDIVTAKRFYTGTLLPHSLHRATSLPVDAVDV